MNISTNASINTYADSDYYNHYNIEMCDPEKIIVPEWANEYFNGIVERIDTTNHLKTFRDFYDYLSRGTTCK